MNWRSKLWGETHLKEDNESWSDDLSLEVYNESSALGQKVKVQTLQLTFQTWVRASEGYLLCDQTGARAYGSAGNESRYGLILGRAVRF